MPGLHYLSRYGLIRWLVFSGLVCALGIGVSSWWHIDSDVFGGAVTSLPLFGGVIICIQLIDKLARLYSNESLNYHERQRLRPILASKIVQLKITAVLYVGIGIFLIFASALSKHPHAGGFVTGLVIGLIAVFGATFIKLLIGFYEVISFEWDLRSRSDRRAERERLLKKLRDGHT
jgi:hypothetical protein